MADAHGPIVTGRPTLGAWVSYAPGSENQNLPAYVVLRNDASLPVDGRGTGRRVFCRRAIRACISGHTGTPVLYLQPIPGRSRTTAICGRRACSQKLNDEHRAAHQAILPRIWRRRIASYEIGRPDAISAAEAALDLSQETAETRSYGVGQPKTDSYGRRCLIARRLVERGVRFVQIFVEGQMWDTHDNNAAGTKACCEQTDKPTAALLKDLKRRGLLDSTLVVWGGEFGRTPVSQGGNGRDHHKQGFSLWMAGGGIKGGKAYGATDELGYHAVENRVMVADLHATILHLLGLDHKRVTYHCRPRRAIDRRV